ncbi:MULTISPECIES: hypothetical protein [Streptomyces]|uniref:Uncharacterized protein n=1 Tax=Streptomyces koelreuteriae TaxID=2838015 RepID=A0ABX8G164_9ACTN|nr:MULTISPECIES: hypothetical protein [Streptomyces]QWB27244.1 hypothetical protein KJK29_34180 [Streptomyces koelreuteriae]UUA10328.1 hypothetical protein NNW98_34375 [Streptomyces koelreuteriae]UUA17935.1 hypothetical protein NNW99_34260 [Streptomyces sp. CRCS-T-1]
MSDGIAWMGAHHHTPSSTVPGMLGGISLTLARGMERDEFLINLGADLDELAARTPCRELRVPVERPGRPSPHLNRAMYGMSGEWTYVLEDWGMATWATGYRGKVRSMLPCEGEEILCLTANRFSPPALIIHAPGARAHRADFGTDTEQGSALDAALSAAGAVFPSMPEASEADVVAHFEEHAERLPELVFTAVGAYTGVIIDQDAVKAGDLPGVLCR